MNLHNLRYHRVSMRALLLVACCCSTVMCCCGARAETLAQVVNPRKVGTSWVSDMAHVIDTSTENRLNAVIDTLERRTRAEMTVVTIRRTDGLMSKPFATALFNRWGVGKKQLNNGVLFLVVTDAHRVEVETGNGMSRTLPEARVQQVLNEEVIPLFKADDYAGGILQGVQTLADDIQTSADKPRPKTVARHSITPRAPHSSPAHRTSSPAHRTSSSSALRTRSQSSQRVPSFPFPATSLPATSFPASSRSAPGAPINWMPFALGGLLLPLGGALAWRSRIRRCAVCNQPMRFLSESEDDVALANDQQFEENLGSVDYRVWRCDKCQTAKVERAVKWFSGYEDCPRCKHRTVASQTDILRHPTYDFAGEPRVTRRCRFPGCAWGDVQMRVLPQRTRPSHTSSHSHHGSHHSSSGGSSHGGSSGGFGGGSSSGGGAGASW